VSELLRVTQHNILREALAELVACKDLKETAEKYEENLAYKEECVEAKLEYSQRQPIAWQKARLALEQIPPAYTEAQKAGYREAADKMGWDVPPEFRDD